MNLSPEQRAGEIIGEIRKQTGFDPLVRTRRKPFVQLRYIVVWALWREARGDIRYTIPVIGATVGLDRCTVYYAIRSVEYWLQHPRQYPFETSVVQEVLGE